jgi:hypothetical protein
VAFVFSRSLGCDFHHLDSDDGGVTCEPTPVLDAVYVLRRETVEVDQYTY